MISYEALADKHSEFKPDAFRLVANGIVQAQELKWDGKLDHPVEAIEITGVELFEGVSICGREEYGLIATQTLPSLGLQTSDDIVGVLKILAQEEWPKLPIESVDAVARHAPEFDLQQSLAGFDFNRFCD